MARRSRSANSGRMWRSKLSGPAGRGAAATSWAGGGAVGAAVGGGPAQDLSQPEGHVLRVLRAHLGEDRREQRVLADVGVEHPGQAREGGCPARPLEERRISGHEYILGAWRTAARRSGWGRCPS